MNKVATFLLEAERDREFALRFVSRAPLGMEVKIQPPPRTTKQERRLRSMIKAMMDGGMKWAGREWESDDWREILISAYLSEKKQETGTLIEGMNGELVVVGRRRGSELYRAEFNELMDMTLATIDLAGIIWVETKQDGPASPEPPPPETDR